ncbi:GH25 family lysozyme [Paraburkholderia sp. C35]|uniref:glycoside hydrolase family 25 protein n=1 Tax=Paraburkholderia sp. C35 TaxID=2126993 RepID=UPI0013A58B45|nr:GH25 family lysozyme [Paraburkholderia sp. C35]
MNYSTSRLIALLLPLCPLVLPMASAAPTVWKNTIDDYSRGALFEAFIVKPGPAAGTEGKSKALNGPFVFPTNAAIDGGKIRENSIFGIDLSHWSSADPQCKRPMNPAKEIDFTTMAGQKVRFVYVKATQDVNYRDCRFAEYWKMLGELKSPSAPSRGAYHFLTATSPGLQQAQSYVRLRTQTGGFVKNELPSVLDLEWDKTSTSRDRWVGTSPDVIIDSAIAWLDHVAKASGKLPILYTSNAWLHEHKFTSHQLERLKPYPLWIADYSQTRRAIEQPSQPASFTWTLWQFTAGSQLSIGPQKPLDATIFKGTEAEFAKVMQLPGE